MLVSVKLINLKKKCIIVYSTIKKCIQSDIVTVFSNYISVISIFMLYFDNCMDTVITESIFSKNLFLIFISDGDETFFQMILYV